MEIFRISDNFGSDMSTVLQVPTSVNKHFNQQTKSRTNSGFDVRNATLIMQRLSQQNWLGEAKGKSARDEMLVINCYFIYNSFLVLIYELRNYLMESYKTICRRHRHHHHHHIPSRS
jgi:hypothetical protein